MVASDERARFGELATISQREDGRRQIAESPLLAVLALNLESSVERFQKIATPQEEEDLLNLLRILRNVCACGPEAAATLLDARVPAVASQVIEATGSPLQIRRVAAQLLANLSACGEAAAAAVWSACWPQTFLQMAEQDSMLGPLAMSLYHCSSTSPDVAEELVSAKGMGILSPLLQEFAQPEEVGDAHLAMLASSLSIRIGSLPGLQVRSGAAADSPPLSDLRIWHAGVLEAITGAIERQTSNYLTRLSNGRGDLLACNLVDLCAAIMTVPRSPDATEVSFLRAGFSFLRSLTSLDDGGASLASGKPIVAALITENGLLEILLAALAALGPIQSLGREESTAVWPSTPQLQCGTYSSTQPYKGYRTDIIAVLGNLAHRRRQVQDELVQVGGVELILAHCQVNEENPFLREAALWCVRNLCEGNFEIQRRIEELQVVKTVESPELRQAGLRVHHDPGSGKFEILEGIND